MMRESVNWKERVLINSEDLGVYEIHLYLASFRYVDGVGRTAACIGGGFDVDISQTHSPATSCGVF
jgi:hypothetical protein